MFGVSDASRFVAGLILVLVPTVEIGGAFLLWMISRRIPGYMDNPVRQALFRAGHAHAGVLVILALVGILYVDRTALSEPTRRSYDGSSSRRQSSSRPDSSSRS